jgi:hypothetical protein
MKDKMHSTEQIIKKLQEADEVLAGIPPSISSMDRRSRLRRLHLTTANPPQPSLSLRVGLPCRRDRRLTRRDAGARWQH